MMRKLRFLLSVQIIILAFTLLLTPPTALADSEKLAAVLAAQPENIQGRYKWRHPQETLEFFGVEPGMRVVEALPGGGWYTKILLPYLGSDGSVMGADYALEMFPLFGFFSDEMLEGKKTWVETWTADAEGWRGENSASVSAFVLGSMPEELKGTADAAIFIRALHNLNRFEPDGGFLTSALKDAFDALKSGGILGVVQHQAPEDKSDAWADGTRGYLKKSHVIAVIENAGFELVGESAVNENPKDQPGDDDVVWRLPPTLSIGDAGDEVADEMRAIGESNRMTLKFRKP
jgi:predicted methyltransferase